MSNKNKTEKKLYNEKDCGLTKDFGLTKDSGLKETTEKTNLTTENVKETEQFFQVGGKKTAYFQLPSMLPL